MEKDVSFAPEVYQKGYSYLFNQITDMIEQLQQTQREAEKMFIESGKDENGGE